MLAPKVARGSSDPRGPEGALCAPATAAETSPVEVALKTVAAPLEGAVRDDDGTREGSVERMPVTTAVASLTAAAETISAGAMSMIGVVMSPPGTVGTPGIAGMTGRSGGGCRR